MNFAETTFLRRSCELDASSGRGGVFLGREPRLDVDVAVSIVPVFKLDGGHPHPARAVAVLDARRVVQVVVDG